jgi:iron-sulfur cluster repair di-iron protein
MCREGFQTGFLAGVIREACSCVQENLESAVKYLPRPRQRGLSLADHWLRPKPARMAPFYTGADRLSPLFDKVCSVHGQNHPELLQIRGLFQGLSQELTTHLMKEEMVLFPYIVRIEEAAIEKEPIVPAPFGTVQNPVSMMEHEHDSAGNALRAMREGSNGYSAPADSCISYQRLYKTLAAFDTDLHQHIHLENNILFPRAIAMEKGH